MWMGCMGVMWIREVYGSHVDEGVWVGDGSSLLLMLQLVYPGSCNLQVSVT